MDDSFDEFDNPDFDPISYINSKFPTEGSLSTLDSQITKLKDQLDTVNTDIMGSIQQHALLNLDIEKEVKTSRDNLKNILQDVQSIKQKAESSESLVTEMCKDIKSLDIAKKNITFSITAIKKFTMMTNAVDQLRDYCENKKYHEVANLISAIEDFFAYFKKYESVSQIQKLFQEKESIIVELKEQIKEDFVAFAQGDPTLEKNTMLEACKLSETLGLKYRNDIIKLVCDMVLKPYDNEFLKADNATIDKIERRYPWLNRRMQDIENIFEGVFPPYWGIKCFILNDFCGYTRLHLGTVFEADADPDVNSLLKGLSETIKFENKITQEMEKEYGIYVDEARRLQEEAKGITPSKEKLGKVAFDMRVQRFGSNSSESLVAEQSREFIITHLPKLKGSISAQFDNYMGVYLKNEENEVKEKLKKAFENDGQYDPQSDLKLLNSSLAMFSMFRVVLKKASQFSRGQLMYDIWVVLQKIIQFYVDEVSKVIKVQEKDKNKDEAFEIFSCLVINTGEYCKDTLQGLTDTVKNYLDPPFKDRVNYDDQEDLFNGLLDKGIEICIAFCEYKLENSFTQIYKTSWDKVSDVGDTSDYVKEIANVLARHINQIKDVIVELYYPIYLNKILDMVSSRFLESFYKTKKVSEMAIQRLQLDVYELKSVLLEMIKLDIHGKKPSNAIAKSFSKNVDKKMSHIENILKLYAMSNDQFTENFRHFLEEDSQDAEKLMIMKGIKKTDVFHSLKKFIPGANK